MSRKGTQVNRFEMLVQQNLSKNLLELYNYRTESYTSVFSCAKEKRGIEMAKSKLFRVFEHSNGKVSGRKMHVTKSE